MDVRLLCVFVCCVGGGLCDELVIRSEVSHRLYAYNCVGFKNLKTRATEAGFGLLHHRIFVCVC